MTQTSRLFNMRKSLYVQTNTTHSYTKFQHAIHCRHIILYMCRRGPYWNYLRYNGVCQTSNSFMKNYAVPPHNCQE